MTYEDLTEDFTAMLIAMMEIYGRLVNDDESDLIDFTHILNKLAVQYVMESNDGK